MVTSEVLHVPTGGTKFVGQASYLLPTVRIKYGVRPQVLYRYVRMYSTPYLYCTLYVQSNTYTKYVRSSSCGKFHRASYLALHSAVPLRVCMLSINLQDSSRE